MHLSFQKKFPVLYPKPPLIKGRERGGNGNGREEEKKEKGH
jgi:hypothetical protein